MSLIRLAELCPDVPISLVGGAVRDALLGRAPGPDLDLVVEGDAIAVARRLAADLDVGVTVHERFGTAALALDDGTLLDLVRARRERYAAPGALPDVSPGTIADDLARRDFTVNAMARRLTGPDVGALLDPHGGVADLAAGVIRALRSDEFTEDPSRILRAARYAARLGFTVDEATARWARLAAPTAHPESARVGEELRRLLEEPDAAEALAIAADLGIGWLVRSSGHARAFAAVDGALASPGAPALPTWAIRLGLAVDPAALARVAVDGWAVEVAGAVARADELVERLATATTPAQVDRVLVRTRPAAQVVAAARGAEAVVDWWAAIRDIRLAVDGDDLLAAGVARGPQVGALLADLRAAVLDGQVGAGRSDQLAWVAKRTG